MSSEQSREMANFFENAIKKYTQPIRHKLMVGVVSLHETLNDLPSEWTDAVPKNGLIADIFIDHSLLLNTIHYVDLEGIDIFANLKKITELGGKYMHALQLDMVWPDPMLIKQYRNQFPQIQIILQVNTPAFELLNDLNEDLVRKIADYGSAIDCVLLDKSMGKGLRMDNAFLRPLLKTIQEKLPNISLAVAGGLGPKSLNLVEPLTKEFPNLCIDAEANLRSSKDSRDPIDWSLAEEYVKKALDLFYVQN
ncbi:MAG: hypothetical protein WC641_05280 [Patescibacteria group bacterium]